MGLQLALDSIPVVARDTLEAASAMLQIRSVTAHADHDVSNALLPVAVQMGVLLVVVRMAAPGYSCVSSPHARGTASLLKSPSFLFIL